MQNTPSAPSFTPEQEAIIASTGDIRINAVAGSGKTTTVVAYAASRPEGSRILYLAFNKSVRQEAQRRFAAEGLRNVQVETAHSLAFKAIVPARGYTVRAQGFSTYEVAELLGLTDLGEKHGAYMLAVHVNRFVAYFCNSDAEKVQQLNYLDTVTDPQAKGFVRTHSEHILLGTRQLLQRMNKGDIAVTHDFYLKLYQLSNPVLRYDYILFDEGQDASPAMLDVFLKQKATKVIVGDAHQQIYGWRHAVNSLERAAFADYPLSTSFRFGTDVADLARAVLAWKNHIVDTGAVSITGRGKAAAVKTKATLARTNLGLLLHAISFVTENPAVQKLYFEGNLHSYTYADDGASLYDVLNLYNGQRERIRDRLIASMNSMAELQEYIEKTEDPQLGMMVEIVEEYGNEIPRLLKELKDKHVGDAERETAAMIFSTVHRAKGMEYDEVWLVADFLTEAKLEKAKENEPEFRRLAPKLNEEINLLYVAVTRARVRLHLPEALLPKGFTPGAAVLLIKKPVAEDRRATAPKPSFLDGLRARKNGPEFWTEERDDQLRKLFHHGLRIGAMAAALGCRPNAVVARLKQLGCVTES